ncbi:DUF1302 domain-containing protein [Marinobacterium sediminicola]|uniref:DUF1302 domain-containing protein n=1 Tax=Marinobacterium sediminicola TaxID=518898 RepID=A0ABY1S405_9GAMM|nr:DUF1302 family protein [Marinobacterium sediminicola]ULG70164.1 DUF1302 domain-containing protein [Marinobacterium sediminicola]SMR78366.1 Protein of unknown function [Marinobacterium sediminicola]
MINKRTFAGPKGFAPLALALAVSQAQAFETVYLGDDTTLDASITLSYTASARTSSPSDVYLNNPNYDDATRNFDQGSLINNRVNALGEIRLRHDNVGALLRGSVFYDDVYRSSNDNDSVDTINKIGAVNRFTDTTREISGYDPRLLDAFVYGNFVIGDDTYLSVKAGRHIVAWGESLFFPNISQGQLPVDAAVFNVPGTEAKEGYLPVGQLSASLTLTDNLTLTGFYQYDWEKTRLNPVGDFFGSDFYGPGAEFIRTDFGNINYAGEIKPSDSGQWGIGARYLMGDSTEIGLFHYRYHDRVGAILTDISDNGSTRYSSFDSFKGCTSSDLGCFQLGYFDDIKLTGVSISSKVGDVQIGGDISYRDNAPVYVASSVSGLLPPEPTRGSYLQTNLNGVYILGPSALAHQTTLMAEVVHQRIHDIDKLTITSSAGSTEYDLAEYDGQTRDNAVLAAAVFMDYPNLFSGWDLTTKAIWTQNLDGSGFAGAGLGRDEKRLTLGADFKYLGNMQVGLTWVNYLSSANLDKGRTMADRDYVSLSAKYTF